MAAEDSVRLVISATAQNALRNINKVKGQIEGLRDKSAQLAGVGAGMTAGITVPLAAAGKQALQTAGEFEKGLNQIQGVTSATAKQMDQLKNTALSVAGSTRFAVNDITSAMDELVRTGADVNAVQQNIGKFTQFAAAAQRDLGESTIQLTDISTQLGIELKNVTQLTDSMVKTANNAATDTTQLGEALTRVAGIAKKNANMNLRETNAILAAFADNGLKGGEAGNRLRGIINRLQKPTKQMQGILAANNVSLRNAQGEFRGMLPIMEDLREAQISGREQAELFGSENLKAGTIMLNNTSKIKQFQESLKDTEGATKDMAEAQRKGLLHNLKLVQSAIDRLFITLANSGAMKVATNAFKAVSGALNSLSDAIDNSPGLGSLITSFATAAAVTGPLIAAIGGLGLAIGAVSTPVIAVSAAIGGLVAAGSLLISNWEQVTNFASRNFPDAMNAINNAIENVTDFFKGLTAAINMDQLSDSAKALGDAFLSILSAVMDVFGAILQLNPAFSGLTDESNNARSAGVRLAAVINTLSVGIEGLATGISIVARSFSSSLEIISTNWSSLTTQISAGTRTMGADFRLMTAQSSNQWQRFINASQTNWRSFTSTVGTLWNSLTTQISAGTRAMGTDFRLMTNQSSNHWQRFIDASQTNWRSFTSTVGTLWNSLTTQLNAGIRRLVVEFRLFAQRVGLRIKQLWTDIKSGASQMVTDVQATIGGLFDKVKGLVSEAKGFAKEVVKSFIQGFENVWNSWVENIDLNPFNNKPIKSQAEDAGKDTGEQQIGDSNMAVGGRVAGAGGTALSKVQKAMDLAAWPASASISSTLRSPARNARVGGHPDSFHLDRDNPAVDVAVPNVRVGDQVAAILRRFGPWREFLWRVPNHYDHIHVAHTGGYVDKGGIRNDEVVTKLQQGERVLPRGTEPKTAKSSNNVNVTMNITFNAGLREDAESLVDRFTREAGEKLKSQIEQLQERDAVLQYDA